MTKNYWYLLQFLSDSQLGNDDTFRKFEYCSKFEFYNIYVNQAIRLVRPTLDCNLLPWRLTEIFTVLNSGLLLPFRQLKTWHSVACIQCMYMLRKEWVGLSWLAKNESWSSCELLDIIHSSNFCRCYPPHSQLCWLSLYPYFLYICTHNSMYGLQQAT